MVCFFDSITVGRASHFGRVLQPWKMYLCDRDQASPARCIHFLPLLVSAWQTSPAVVRLPALPSHHRLNYRRLLVRRCDVESVGTPFPVSVLPRSWRDVEPVGTPFPILVPPRSQRSSSRFPPPYLPLGFSLSTTPLQTFFGT